MEAKQAVIAVEGTYPYSDFRPIVRPDVMTEVEVAIERGEAPAVTVVARKNRLVKRDDDNGSFAH